MPNAGERARAGASAYLKRLFYELAISTNPHAIASVLQFVPTSQVLYGSNCPALAEADVSALIHGLVTNPLLQPDGVARIERQNALELFRRLLSSAEIH